MKKGKNELFDRTVIYLRFSGAKDRLTRKGLKIGSKGVMTLWRFDMKELIPLNFDLMVKLPFDYAYKILNPLIYALLDKKLATCKFEPGK